LRQVADGLQMAVIVRAVGATGLRLRKSGVEEMSADPGRGGRPAWIRSPLTSTGDQRDDDGGAQPRPDQAAQPTIVFDWR